MNWGMTILAALVVFIPGMTLSVLIAPDNREVRLVIIAVTAFVIWRWLSEKGKDDPS